MPVFDVVAFDVKPGGMDAFLAQMKALKRILERVDVGLTSFRLVESTLAGPNSGRVTFVAEYVDLASWSASVENEMQDAELGALFGGSSGPDVAYTMVGRSLLTEITL